MGRRRVLWVVALLYSVVLVLLAALPNLPTPDLGIAWTDKLEHAGAYGLMAALAGAALGARGQAGGGWRWAGKALLWAGALGLLTEILQLAVPERDADVMDWIADLVGALLALGALWWWRRRRRRSLPVTAGRPAAEVPEG